MPGEVALGPAEAAEPHVGVGHGVQGGERVDQCEAAGPDLLVVVVVEVLAAADRHPVHVGHHGERRADDGGVLAQGHRFGDRDAGSAEGADDPVLAAHVMGGGGEPAQWRASQHPAVDAVGDQVGEVGTPAVEQLRVDRAGRAGDLTGEPRPQRRQVQALGSGTHFSPSRARTSRPIRRLAIAQRWVSEGPS
jgi:hypothetical protein